MKNDVTKYNVDDLYYYHYRNKIGRPMITVCVCKKGSIFSRGISICSVKDMPNKKVGRKIARDRALKALFNKGTFDYASFRQEIIDVLDTYEQHVTIELYKSEYLPTLTSYEMELLGFAPRKVKGYLNENGN